MSSHQEALFSSSINHGHGGVGAQDDGGDKRDHASSLPPQSKPLVGFFAADLSSLVQIRSLCWRCDGGLDGVVSSSRPGSSWQPTVCPHHPTSRLPNIPSMMDTANQCGTTGDQHVVTSSKVRAHSEQQEVIYDCRSMQQVLKRGPVWWALVLSRFARFAPHE
jgi:hypothetical protein